MSNKRDLVVFKKSKSKKFKFRSWKRKYNKPAADWVGVIRLVWLSEENRESYSYVQLFESFDGNRYYEYSVKNDRYFQTLTRHDVYHGDIVPWINGFDIRASCFYTRNPNHDSIYEDKNLN